MSRLVSKPISHLENIISLLLVSPLQASDFLLLAQEKVTKEKGTPGAACFLRSSRMRGRAQLGARAECSFRSGLPRTGRAPGSRMRCGTRRGTRGPQSWLILGPRQAQPSIAGLSGKSEPPCRAGLANRQVQQVLRVRRAPERPRSTGNPDRHPGCRSGQAFGGAFLLGTFLWRDKEKYLAPAGRKEQQIQYLSCNVPVTFEY